VKHRLYIDEVGNPDLGASADPNHRFLSLTGVALDLAYVDNTVFPALEALKRKFFGSHPDDPVVLHRKELVNKKPPFEALTDTNVETAFNAELLALFQNWDYTVLTVVIDKLEHQQRYRTWRFDPYHYCLTVMVERFVLWLCQRDAQGDVMSESRGGKEDRRLKDSFERVFEQGSDFVPPDQFRARLTSRQAQSQIQGQQYRRPSVGRPDGPRQFPRHACPPRGAALAGQLRWPDCRDPRGRQIPPQRRRHHRRLGEKMAALKKSAPKGAEGQGLPPPANWIGPSLAPFATRVNSPNPQQRDPPPLSLLNNFLYCPRRAALKAGGNGFSPL
jgi:hypothetical protein